MSTEEKKAEGYFKKYEPLETIETYYDHMRDFSEGGGLSEMN